jgi:DNA invertase Pin-like site-specific DNA recombinase
MIVGVPQADIRKQIKADLERQIDAFLNRGKEILEVPAGASKEAPFYGATGHTEKLRAKRDRMAPAVRELADKGIAKKGIAKELKLNASTVALILKENKITIAAGH